MSDENKTCLMPGCDSEAEIRGICKSCYQASARLVRQGETTWEILEERGLVLKAAPGRTRSAAHQAITSGIDPSPAPTQEAQ